MKTFRNAFTPIALGTLAIGVTLQAVPAYAQVFPAKPVRIIVGVPAGAGPDVELRQLTVQMSVELGQPIVVENRPGNAQLLGLELAAKSAPDGYTLGFGQVGNLAANPRLFGKPPYDVERDFVPVSLSLKHPWLLYVNAGVPASNLAEFVSLAKAKPNSITYASTGVGSFLHITMEWFQALTGTQLRHVPYGASPFAQDLISGQVDAVMYPSISLVDHVRTGKLRSLAIANRAASGEPLPDVPTFAQSGLPQFDAAAWAGLVAPAGTPAAIIDKLAAAAARAAQGAHYREFTEKIGAVPVGSSSSEFDAFLRTERARWKKVIEDRGIRIE